MTKPKYRPLAIPTTPGSAAVASASITSSGSVGVSGSGPPSAARNSSTLASGRIGRCVERLEEVGGDLRRSQEQLALVAHA